MLRPHLPYKSSLLPPGVIDNGRCLSCGIPITWAEQRRQFGRLVKVGANPQTAKAAMPRCYRCVTSLLHLHAVVGVVSKVSDLCTCTPYPTPFPLPQNLRKGRTRVQRKPENH